MSISEERLRDANCAHEMAKGVFEARVVNLLDEGDLKPASSL